LILAHTGHITGIGQRIYYLLFVVCYFAHSHYFVIFIMSSMTFKRMGFSSRASNVSQRLRTYASSSLLSSQTHLIFGANTDVGKTVVSAGLIRASLVTGNTTHYIKPLQCGGSDERFIIRYAPNTTSSTTLYEWETPVSPHYASRLEQYPVSDEQVLTSLRDCLDGLKGASHVWVETAGGVLSPSSSSPDNSSPRHAHDKSGWGWVTQADLYRPLIERSSVVMIGDGRLGGISSTLSSLESLLVRGYNVSGVILLESGYDNQEAIQEYASRYVQ
jgi:dethiobiotin synthetase/adenosylmethionine--8-amino-7-oxononanoate aminotransferase